MERTTKRNFIAVSFFFGLIGVGLMIAAFATDHWIRSSPMKPDIVEMNSTVQSGGTETKNTGNITFGLFRGYRVLDYSTGPRRKTIYVTCNPSFGVCMWTNLTDSNMKTKLLDRMIASYKNQTAAGQNETVKDLVEYGLFSFGLWVSTIVTLALGVVWGLVAIMFAVFNVFGKPIETITGPAGLYLWNGLALLFSLLACLLFVGLYVTGIQKNILPKEDRDIGWTSEGRTHFDYSFYLVVGAAGSFLLNIVLLVCSGLRLSCSFAGASEKEVDGMILY